MAEWRPPTFVARDEVIAESNLLLGAPDIPLLESEDVFRITTMGLDWDIGVMIYEPADGGLIPLTHSHITSNPTTHLFISPCSFRSFAQIQKPAHPYEGS